MALGGAVLFVVRASFYRLNGKHVGYADNYYREWLFDVTVREGEGRKKEGRRELKFINIL